MRPGKTAPAPAVDETRAMARLMFDRIHGPAEATAKTMLARKVGGTNRKRAKAVKTPKPAD